MSNKKQVYKEVIAVIVFAISLGSVVAYAHTTFAYRDDVKELRKMVYDIWKHEGLHKVKK